MKWELKRSSKSESVYVYMCILVSFVHVSLELRAVNAYDYRTRPLWNCLNYGFSCFCEEIFTSLSDVKITTLGISFTLRPVQGLK